MAGKGGTRKGQYGAARRMAEKGGMSGKDGAGRGEVRNGEGR